MSEPGIAPYGSWKSPISSDLITGGSIALAQPMSDGADVYWLEMRPVEQGRSVIVRRTASGAVEDVIPPAYNARTRVHEYGGGDYAVHKGTVYFSNFTDQRIYRCEPGEPPTPISPEGRMRYADFVVDPSRGRLICIREEHTETQSQPTNSVVAVKIDGEEGAGEVLISGNDFYSSPRLSPDGSKLAWLTWNHPNMPWDGTELWVATFDENGSIPKKELVAGGLAESIFQPDWSQDGVLHFVSDRTGWWNIYRLRDGAIESLCQMEAEFGLPQWGFGMSTYAFASADQIVCAYIEKGISQLGLIDTPSRKFERIDSSFSDIRSLSASQRGIVMRAASPTEVASIVEFDLDQRTFAILKSSASVSVDSSYFSIARAVEFPTEGGLTAHGFFYPPTNPDFVAPDGERPPLLVKSHGGPTAAATTALTLGIQFWTSRGIAVLDVNYGGSTGYGRAYRERLNDTWGIVDVDDCANGARYLVQQGEVDEKRLLITGGSAGGYTTLCALTFRDVFSAGASHFGVSDAEALAKETHKFESRYLDRLMGPYPEKRAVYISRSPINFTDRLSCPVIFFQGLEDKVVPPNQAETMVAALKEKGIPVAYLPFAGEQHGFRQAKNIKRSLDGELYFYSRVLGFELAEPVEPVPIENL
ncbi:MAG TPA: S9 family peptidase [Pyrinomonadaceae bacterium]|nr:S9 family peptidase [Pyrinomonadaceae bacterium]